MGKFIYYILIAVILGSCTKKQGSIITLDNSMIREYPGKSFFPDFIDDWDFIKLETTTNSLIGEVINVEFDEGKIFVATRPPMDGYWVENHLKVFDENGKYLMDIGSQGRGPEEYLNINNFRIDKKNKLVVVRDNNRFVYKYNYDGNLVEKIDTSADTDWPLRFYCLPDGNVLLYHHLLPKSNTSTFTVANGDFKKIATLDTVVYNMPKNMSGYSTNTLRYPVAIQGNDVVLLKDFCDTVFIYSEGKLKPVCNLASYGTMPKGRSKSDIINDYGQILELVKPPIIKSVYAMHDRVLIYENENMLVLNKSFDKGFEVRVVPEREEATPVPIGRTPPQAYYRVDGVRDDRLYSFIQAIDLVEYRDQCKDSRMELSDEQKALFNGLSDNDNPVLVFYEIRERPI